MKAKAPTLASRISGATGSTGVPMDKSTIPSGWAPASAFASAKVSQGNSGRDADTAGRRLPGSCSTGPAQSPSPCGGRSLTTCGSFSVMPTLAAPPGDPSSSKKSALICV